MTHSVTDEILAEVIGDLTVKNILEAAGRILKESIYEEFPTANPASIEMAILIYQEGIYEIFSDTGIFDDTVVLDEALTEKAERLGETIRRAILKMNN